LLPDLRLENVAMPLLVRGEDFTTALGMARKWLAEVAWKTGPITVQGNSPEGTARAAIAGRSSPGVVLRQMNLPEIGRAECLAVFELLERLHRTHRLTSLIATHNLALAAV